MEIYVGDIDSFYNRFVQKSNIETIHYVLSDKA